MVSDESIYEEADKDPVAFWATRARVGLDWYKEWDKDYEEELPAGHFFGALPVLVLGIEGIFCGSAAVYGSAAVILQAKYGQWVFPIGLPRES